MKIELDVSDGVMLTLLQSLSEQVGWTNLNIDNDKKEIDSNEKELKKEDKSEWWIEQCEKSLKYYQECLEEHSIYKKELLLSLNQLLNYVEDEHRKNLYACE